jgi:predicted membrane metal-binding protein
MSDGIHADIARREQKVGGGSDRTFGFVFAAVFALLGLWPLVHGTGPRWWALVVAVGFAVTAQVRPSALASLNRLWTAFGHLLHRIVSPIVIGLLFYLVVTPVGLVMRATGKDPMRLRRDPNATSYWIMRDPPGPAAETMRQQF